MPGYEKTAYLIEAELAQSREEGKDLIALETLRKEIETANPDLHQFEMLHEKFLALPMRPDFPFQEPSDLESIRQLRQGKRPRFTVDWRDHSLGDKMYGAWLGRCVGCALGKPLENFMYGRNGLHSYQMTQAYLTAISPEEWPIRDYVPAHSPAEDKTGPSICRPSTRDEIAYMQTDDDIRYTVLGQRILLQHGHQFSTWEVARAWIGQLCYAQLCTAETQAYRNLVMRYRFHNIDNLKQEVDWNWVATHFNPYREWIGAQIRVDSYGYAAPGNPELAADLAWRDARMTHVKSGIYGAMFCAAMIAAAFATSNVREIIEAGLAEIPATSRLHAEMRQVIAICDRYHCDPVQFESIISAIYDLLGHYHPVHTNNNAALCVAALLLSGGDFAKGITLAVMGGWDTDCNGATVGSIVGAITGARQAPEHWTARLNDTLNSELIDYHPIAISECARRALDIAKRVASRQ